MFEFQFDFLLKVFFFLLSFFFFLFIFLEFLYIFLFMKQEKITIMRERDCFPLVRLFFK